MDLCQNDGNEDIINFIDTSYVKIYNNPMLVWLQSVLEIVSGIASKDANLDQENLCVPNKYFPGSVHFIIKGILGNHKPQGWESNIHL